MVQTYLSRVTISDDLRGQSRPPSPNWNCIVWSKEGFLYLCHQHYLCHCPTINQWDRSSWEGSTCWILCLPGNERTPMCLKEPLKKDSPVTPLWRNRSSDAASEGCGPRIGLYLMFEPDPLSPTFQWSRRLSDRVFSCLTFIHIDFFFSL